MSVDLVIQYALRMRRGLHINVILRRVCVTVFAMGRCKYEL
jgi:hypothetical protein